MSKEEIKRLIAERDHIDSQLQSLRELLQSHGVGMDTPLVDEEGFPIADLDILSIRKARNSIVCLVNDRKALTEKIEVMLNELHSSTSSSLSENEPMQQDVEAQPHRTTNRPFLKCENVVYGSPAFYSGLLVDDLIVQFGSIHGDNFEGLQKFSEMIQEHVGNVIHITVLRKTKVHRLEATPGKFEGPGIFGARFGVINNE